MGTGVANTVVNLNLPVSGLTDITSYVMVDQGITISVGASDQDLRPRASSLHLTLLNTDGRFSPSNVSGAYFGQIGRGIPITVLSGTTARFSGYIDEFDVKWDLSANLRTVQIKASGITRRLSLQSTLSPIKALYTGVGQTNPPVAYWPLEGATQSQALGSALGHVSASVNNDSVSFGGFSGLPSSDALVQLPSSTSGNIRYLTATVPSYTIGASHTAFSFILVRTGDTWSSNTTLFTAFFASNGTLGQAVVTWVPASNGYEIIFKGQGLTGGTIATTAILGNGTSLPLTNRLFFECSVTQSGANINYVFRLADLGSSTGRNFGNAGSVNASGTLTSQTFGTITNLTMGSTVSPSPTNAAYGHVAVWTGGDGLVPDLTVTTSIATYPIFAYLSEKADTRIKRLSALIGVTATTTQVASTDVGQPMGFQPIDSVYNNIVDAQNADGGLLFDSLSTYGLQYRSRRILNYLSPVLTLNVNAGHLMAAPAPVYDDTKLVTQAQVTQTGGSVYTYTIPTSNIVYPSLKNIYYTANASINVARNVHTMPAAEQMVYDSQVLAPRIPSVKVNLRSNTSLQTAFLSMLPGDRITIQNPPADLGKDNFDLVAYGWTEYIDLFDWTVEFNTGSAQPRQVGFIGNASYRLDTSGSTITSPGYNTTATSISVTTTNTNGQVWTTAAGDLPFDIVCPSTNERMTVTAISGTTSPQTFTVMRSVNGVVASLATGVAINVWQPFRISR